MKYTVRYAHLDYVPDFQVGDEISRGDRIGRMGSSGQSTAAHLHIDCVELVRNHNWSLKDMEIGLITPNIRQLNFFLDKELFNSPVHITTYIGDPEYQAKRGKVHIAYDVVPKNRHITNEFYDIYWNRSMKGVVTFTGTDDAYGHTILISYEV